MQLNLSIKTFNKIILFLYVVFFISIIYTFRGITSIVIGLLFITGTLAHKKATGKLFPKKLLSPFIIGCLLLFILNAISLIYTNNLQEDLNHISLLTALVFVPLAVSSSMCLLNRALYIRLMKYFTIIMVLSSLYCLGAAILKLFSGEGSSVLFYHSLVKPLNQHAIHYSIYVFFDLLFLIEYSKHGEVYKNKLLLFTIVGFLSIFLFLLSSKLVLGFYLLYLTYKFLRNFKNFRTSWKYVLLIPVTIIIGILVIASKNPIGDRFREITSSNLQVLNQSKFSQGDYIDGLQFRLLQWKFTHEIMEESHKWIIGLTPGDAQSYINNKYIAYNLYTGKPGTADHGFLGYNTHNQFLQCLLETGILGLSLFIFLCITLIQFVVKKKTVQYSFLTLTILAFCFTDTPLGTQYGLIIFLFFPIFSQIDAKIYTDEKQKR